MAVRTNVGTGDKGLTSLLSGERVPKHHARVEACGELDELASVLGALASALSQGDPARTQVAAIQVELLNIGAWVASTPDSPVRRGLRAPSSAPLEALEEAIQGIEKDLPPLQGFLLPGGVLGCLLGARGPLRLPPSGAAHGRRPVPGAPSVPEPALHLSLRPRAMVQPPGRDRGKDLEAMRGL